MSAAAGLSPEMCDMVVQTLRQVVKRDLPDEKILELDEQDIFPEDLIRHLLSPDVGLHLIFLPETAGGLGGGARDICRISEEMARVDLGVATAFLAICLGTDPILVGGTDQQKQHWLSRIAAEGLIVAYGVTEPEAGSNVAALKTVAERITGADGEVTGYRINGAKQFITNGGVAQLFTILAKTPDGPTFFIVERGTPGLTAGKQEDKHGIRASNTTGLLLEDVEVPVANVVGGVEGQGLKQANAVFGYTRLMVGAFGLGGGQAALDRALDYAKTRHQFGKPLIEKEGYCNKILVQHWVDLAAGRAYCDGIALRLDEGEDGLATEGAIAKLWSTEAGCRAADAAIQAHGGYGYTREYMVEKYRRDVRITTIYEGTSEILQSIIGLYRWKETVRSKGEFYAGEAARVAELDGTMSVGAALVAGALRNVNDLIGFCHTIKITRHQTVMFELADLITRCEVAAALATKAARMRDDDDREAPVFCAMSRIFARQTAEALVAGIRRCTTGLLTDTNPEVLARAKQLYETVSERAPMAELAGLWHDMALVGEALKTRT